MMRTVMKSKLHNAIVTEADLHYQGSITIDEDLMKKSDIIEGERVQVVNLNNGERLETYVIVGKKGSGVIGMNGPAALKCEKGHKIHIISYALVEANENIKGKVIFLRDNNKITEPHNL